MNNVRIHASSQGVVRSCCWASCTNPCVCLCHDKLWQLHRASELYWGSLPTANLVCAAQVTGYMQSLTLGFPCKGCVTVPCSRPTHHMLTQHSSRKSTHTHTHLCLLCCILCRPLLLGQGLAPLGLCSRLSLWQQQTMQYSVSKRVGHCNLCVSLSKSQFTNLPKAPLPIVVNEENLVRDDDSPGRNENSLVGNARTMRKVARCRGATVTSWTTYVQLRKTCNMMHNLPCQPLHSL